MEEIYENLNSNRTPKKIIVIPTIIKHPDYTAKVSYKNRILSEKTGDNFSQLQAWVLMTLGNLAWGEGEIIYNVDHHSMCRYRKSHQNA